MVKTKEQKRAEYRAKREQEKKRRQFETAWYEHKMNICYNDDYYVVYGQYEYIVYQDKYTDKRYHVDFVNGMRFSTATYEQCEALIETYA